jgi:hypothetical protein
MVGAGHQENAQAGRSDRFVSDPVLPHLPSSADVQEILAAGSGDVEVMVHLNSESTGSISDGRGYIEIERWFSTHQLVSYASQESAVIVRFTSSNRRHSQEGSKYGKQSLKT